MPTGLRKEVVADHTAHALDLIPAIDTLVEHTQCCTAFLVLSLSVVEGCMGDSTSTIDMDLPRKFCMNK